MSLRKELLDPLKFIFYLVCATAGFAGFAMLAERIKILNYMGLLFACSGAVAGCCTCALVLRYGIRALRVIVVWLAICAIVVMCLFPPWLRVVELEGFRIVSSSGYHFLLSPPQTFLNEYYTGGRFGSYEMQNALDVLDAEKSGLRADKTCIDYVQVDLQRLGIQCAVVALIMAGLLYTLHSPKEQRTPIEQKDTKPKSN